ncbi:ABC transporter permease [Halocatena marina]|uniref:ABC transporter permease n=1 Tax=Halocatena marina TaxID=2934937 RepID=UPI00200DBAF1|nr:ABC transporter permease [Halocatena marina]
MNIDRIQTALGLRFRQYARDRLFLVLLVYLPVMYVGLISQMTPSVDLPVRVSVGMLTLELMRPMGQINGVVMTAAASVFITGIVGLFTMFRSRDADRRLVRTGFGSTNLVVSRIGLLLLVSVVATAFGTGVLLFSVWPNHLGQFVFGVIVLAVTYGFVGLAVGQTVDRLAGLYVMLFVPMLDIAVFQNPTFIRGDPPTWMTVLPSYHAMQVILDAAFGGGARLLNVELAVVVLGLAGLLAGTTFHRAGVIHT